MASLVARFQEDLLSTARSVTELLRVAKVISVKLGLSDITGWIEKELAGYSDGEAGFPPYRLIRGGDLQVLNVHAGGWIPCGHLGKTFPIGSPISELEELTKSSSVVIPIPHHNNFKVQGFAGVDLSHFQQQIRFSNTDVKGMVSAVRDRLLDWALELEKRGIYGKGMKFGEEEKKSAQTGTFNIQNFHGILGDVSHSNVALYDYSTIHQTLKDRAVPQEARNEIETILDELKSASTEQRKSLLERGVAWVAKHQDLLGSAASIVMKALGSQ